MAGEEWGRDMVPEAQAQDLVWAAAEWAEVAVRVAPEVEEGQARAALVCGRVVECPAVAEEQE